MRDELRDELAEPRLERAIGVVYRRRGEDPWCARGGVERDEVLLGRVHR